MSFTGFFWHLRCLLSDFSFKKLLFVFESHRIRSSLTISHANLYQPTALILICEEPLNLGKRSIKCAVSIVDVYRYDNVVTWSRKTEKASLGPIDVAITLLYKCKVIDYLSPVL